MIKPTIKLKSNAFSIQYKRGRLAKDDTLKNVLRKAEISIFAFCLTLFD